MSSFEVPETTPEGSGELRLTREAISGLRVHLTRLIFGISHNTPEEKTAWKHEARQLLAGIHPDRHDDPLMKRIATIATRVVDAYAGKATSEDLNGLLSVLAEIEQDLGYLRPAWAPKNPFESAEARPVDWGAEKK